MGSTGLCTMKWNIIQSSPLVPLPAFPVTQKSWNMRKKSRYPETPSSIRILRRHGIKGCEKSPCLSHFCVTAKVSGASSQHAMSHVREPWLCQALVHHSLAEVPCSVTYFLKLFAAKLQMGSRLTFARIDRKQCHFSPLEMIRLTCHVLWSWIWSSECTLNIQKLSGQLLPLCFPRLSCCTDGKVLFCLLSLTVMNMLSCTADCS